MRERIGNFVHEKGCHEKNSIIGRLKAAVLEKDDFAVREIISELQVQDSALRGLHNLQ